MTTKQGFRHGKDKVHAAFYPTEDEYKNLRVTAAEVGGSISEYVLSLVRADQAKRERKAAKK
jgi:hypothetical protein